MDAATYYRSLSLEIEALKGRVRQLIQSHHWQTDGEWKETVLRSVFRRHLPPGIGVGRGFIVGERGPSSQIDVLLYNTSYPVLHQDGDLVFVVPDAVRAIIEVKATLTPAIAAPAFRKLADNAALIRDGAKSIFVGLFAFDAELGARGITSLFPPLQAAAEGTRKRAVNHICAGPSHFARFWMHEPFTNAKLSKWYGYEIGQMAAGYFVFNALESVVGEAVRQNLWAFFPRDGKEAHKIAEAPLIAAPLNSGLGG
jgi:hypothetical protein